MAKVPATINQLPAHLQRLAAVVIPQDGDDAFDVEGGLPIGLLSIKGKVFTRRIRKNKEIIMAGGNKKIPMPFLDVLFIGARPGKSKTFYAESFEDGSDARPTCASTDGIRPDPGPTALKPKDGLCVNCKWDAFGTALQGTGKRCGDNKRVAVLPLFDPENEDWGGPMLLRVPPSSFANYMEYAMERKREGGHITMCVTRLSFVPEAPAPKLEFEFQRWLDEDETEFVLQAMNDPRLDRVLSITTSELHDDPNEVPAGSTEELPEAGLTPAAQKTSSAADKLAAVRAQAKKQAAPSPTAAKVEPTVAPKQTIVAKPNGAGKTTIIAKPKPTPPSAEELAPAAKPKPNVVSLQPKPAAPEATRAPTAAEIMAAKKARLQALLAEATELDAEVNPEEAEEGTEAAEVEAAATEGEEYIEEEGGEAGEVSTDDLLGELDAELGSLPDDE